MMSRERWRRLEPILDAALELPTSQVPSYLDRICLGEPDVREDVERLLAVLRDERDGVRFLNSPPTALAARVLAGADSSASGLLEEGAEIGPYRVLRQLGRGGMGVVYLARDSRLERLVALKLLPPWLAADQEATRRLADEAKTASALDHPNIETVHDIGHTEDGRLYIAIAYYEGETLESRLREGPLPVDEAVELAAQLARGLRAAHVRGVVHRDVKPANVILTTDGVAKLVDFGVAKATRQDRTGPGATPGTVAYMSPEQTRGEGVDSRTDVWALGVVLYEMLAGNRPFRGDSQDAVIFAIRHDQPQPLGRRRPDVPDALARVVRRCLAKDAGARYQSAGELHAALERLPERARGTGRWRKGAVAAATAALALLAVVLGLIATRGSRAGSFLGPPGEAGLPGPARLAVLPLIDSSPRVEDAYLADGLTEELMSRLSTVGGLRVIASASVMPYRDTDKSTADIGRELGVRTLLAGSVRKVSDRVRISVGLVDVGSQEQLWSEEYDTGVADVPTVVRGIAEEVVRALEVKTRAYERRQVAKPGTESAGAYTEYLKGRYFLAKLDGGAFEEARSHFERSLDLDPTFAPAWSGLSNAYSNLAELAMLPAREAYPRARAAAERGLELNPELAEAHAALAMTLAMYYWETEAAERHFRQALELDPSTARARRLYAVHLRNMGRFREALTEVRTAQELDPLSAFSHVEEGRILYVARRYDQAIAKYQQLLRSAPGHRLTHFYLALALAQTARYDEALAALRMVDPQERPDAPAIRGYVYARMGRREPALQMMGMLDELSKERGVSSFQKAAIYVGLGDHDQALALLEQAAEERTWHVRLLGVEPIFDPLRGEPRFRALLEKVNLVGGARRPGRQQPSAPPHDR